jgi:Family of unknown function (DUF6152)
MRKLLLAAITIVGMSSVPRLLAHHSFGGVFDVNKPVTASGVVTKVDYINPHAHFMVDIKDATGNVVNWTFEGYPPTVLYRTGWKRSVTIKPGDTVTVFGWQARDGTHLAHGRQVTLADGNKLYFGPPAGTGDGGERPAVDLPEAGK